MGWFFSSEAEVPVHPLADSNRFSQLSQMDVLSSFPERMARPTSNSKPTWRMGLLRHASARPVPLTCQIPAEVTKPKVAFAAADPEAHLLSVVGATGLDTLTP